MDFLKVSFYAPSYKIAPHGWIDCAIPLDDHSETPIGVISEVKTPNSPEMITRSDVNRKALQEIVLSLGACGELRNTLDNNVVQSMFCRENCRNNAVAESFFKSLKCELIYGNKLLSAEPVDLEIFEYIEIFYNKIRRYPALKNRSIDENY